MVSIPSRRVGDPIVDVFGNTVALSFHPLKAGRRLRYWTPIEKWEWSFHPLKAGRRPSTEVFVATKTPRFHPLKAGRRQWLVKRFFKPFASFHPLKAGRRPIKSIQFVPLGELFPSPQGGSETKSMALVVL